VDRKSFWHTHTPTPFHWGNVPIAEGISPKSILTSKKLTSSSLDLDFEHHRLLSSGKVLLLHRTNASKISLPAFFALKYRSALIVAPHASGLQSV
jgi:hypothetical protein